jgi:mannose-6-phosphate isomerase-like protein (cupin superfamily)
MEMIEKGWGREIILESNDKYCMKVLQFDKEGSTSSMHFHKEKDETWTVLSGSIKVEMIDLATATTEEVIIEERGVIRLKPMTPHKVTALQDMTSIMECSSPDSEEDNYRIYPGDSQQQTQCSSEKEDKGYDFNNKSEEPSQSGVKMNLLEN